MDNQHKKTTGYRDLTQAGIDLMNEIKSEGALIEQLIERVKKHLSETPPRAQVTELDAAGNRKDIAEPMRWIAMARTDFQTAIMKLTRAVAQPTNF